MTNVVFADFGDRPVELDKAEIADRLGYCTRTVEKLTAEGMPSTIRGRRRTYQETKCRNWLNARGEMAHARQAVS